MDHKFVEDKGVEELVRAGVARWGVGNTELVVERQTIGNRLITRYFVRVRNAIRLTTSQEEEEATETKTETITEPKQGQTP